jgi:hypothetical protein
MGTESLRERACCEISRDVRRREAIARGVGIRYAHRMKSRFPLILVVGIWLTAVPLLAETSPIFSSTDSCLAVINGNAAQCDNLDCDALVYDDVAYCQTEDCRGMTENALGFCESNDCRAVVEKSEGFCSSNKCRGIVTGELGYCYLSGEAQ